MLCYKSLANFSPQRYTLKSKCQRKINKKAVKPKFHRLSFLKRGDVNK